MDDHGGDSPPPASSAGRRLAWGKVPPVGLATSSGKTPHSLRHSFESIHISEGKSIEWVQKQLGHEDYTLTVNTYSSWLPSKDEKGNDSLDDPGWEASQ